jgi:hypothetical protein
MTSMTTFDPTSELIVVDALIQGPRRESPARLVLDTGAAATLVVPDLLYRIGYSARDA